VAALMTRGMLLGIKRRAEAQRDHELAAHPGIAAQNPLDSQS